MASRTGAAVERRATTVALDFAALVWRPLTSVRFALALILLIASTVLAGTLLEQAPASVVGNTEAYDRWLDQVWVKYGALTPLLDRLQFFNIFQSLWFRMLLALLAISTVACTANRWRTIRAAVFETRVRMPPAFFERSRLYQELAAPLAIKATAAAVRDGLRSAGYRTLVEDGETVALYADKNRFGRFGTFLTHLSILVILLAAFAGALLGETDDAFVVAEGMERSVPMEPSISVKLERFSEEYYLDGTPRDFRSELVVYESGREVERRTVRVNSPLRYEGIRFHQAFFGPSADLRVTDASGDVLMEEGVPLAWRSLDGQRPVGYFRLSGEDVRAYVVGSASGVTDPIVPAGEVRLELYDSDSERPIDMVNLSLGEPVELAGLTFTFLRERSFVGFRVVKHPTMNLIWAAGGLFVLGLVMVLYFPHRRIWALCERADDGRTHVRLAATSSRDLGVADEFSRLAERVRVSLARASRNRKAGERV
jgi:cytochrome c biogenesis protein